MEFLLSNGVLIIAAIAVIAVAGYAFYKFSTLPTESQILQVREWLLWAVSKAEKELGSGTGKLKLRYVYDMFLTKFPYLADIIDFNQFSYLVDEALDEFKEILNNNASVANYVNLKEEK